MRTFALAAGALLLVALACISGVSGCSCGRDDEAGDAAPPAAGVEGAVAPPDAAELRAEPGVDVPLAEPRVAIWVPCEGALRPLDEPARIPRLLEVARELGATDLFVQVYRGGRAWFESPHVDDAPWSVVQARTGVDPLRALLDDAHAAGIRVHAWANALSLSTRRESGLLASDRLGRDAVQVDRRGRSVLDYPDLELPQPDRAWYRMGTRQVWLDPAAAGVAETLAAVLGDLAARYPIDGVHLDYIRYPDVLPFVPGSRFGVGLDFGYGEASRARFEAETGLVAPLGDRIGPANRWDDWRREQVTRVVRLVSEAVREAGRGRVADLELSAAVWTYADRAYLALFQDWRGWLDARLLDFAVPMAYTRDDRLLHYLGGALTGGVAGGRVWLGLGTWLFDADPARAAAQLDIARAHDPAGIAYFSYDALGASGGEALRRALVPADRSEARSDARP